MRTPILLSAHRAAAHYRPLGLTKSHHAALSNSTLIAHSRLHFQHRFNSSSSSSSSSPSSSPQPPLPLNLTPQDIQYNKTLNPPPTTRPPPFSIPENNPSLSLPRNLLAKGKAILTFYKTGLKSILVNRRLCYTPLDSLPEPLKQLKPYPDTRAALILKSRLRHDLGRLMPLSLILLVCAEFTPVVILGAPNLKVTPLTCRMPREVEAIRGRDRVVRKRARELYGKGEGEVDVVVGEVLRVGRPRFVPGWIYPGVMRKGKLERRLAWIVADDAMIVQGGGEGELVVEEVRVALEERGVDVLGKGEEELRGLLRKWLEITAQVEDLDVRREVVKRMVLQGEERWGRWERWEESKLTVEGWI